MSSKIVEIPIVSSDSGDGNSRKQSTVFDSFDFLNNEEAHYANSIPSIHMINRIDSNQSISSFDSEEFSSSFFLSEDDILPNFSSVFSFPESTSVEDLSNKLGNLPKPSMSGHKQEKEEDDEEDTGESSVDVSEEESEELLKKEKYNGNNDFNRDDIQRDQFQSRPIKKKKFGINHEDSFSSISSYSSGDSSSDESGLEDEDDNFEDDEEDNSINKKNSSFLAKKYKQPILLRADNLTIGNWSLNKLDASNEVTLDVKILFGRRKVKYEIKMPQKRMKYKTVLAIDFPFSYISGLELNPKDKCFSIQLGERPTFSKKDKSKSIRISDFTEGAASNYQRHHIQVNDMENFSYFTESFLECDRKLRKLSKLGLTPKETTFQSEETYQTEIIPPCDWDKDNKATKHCENCKNNYCDVCDDVLHRHESQKSHNRIQIQLVVRPKSKKLSSLKKRKKMNNDRCRCGTGATKGTLGEPCTGNRCPCFSNGKSCLNCGCKGDRKSVV